MQDRKEDIQVHFEGKDLVISQIATFIVFFFPPLAGAFYVGGSMVYWPSFTNINPNTGGILFTIGSVLLVLTDLAGSYLEPEFNLFKPFKNVGSFKGFWSFIGNMVYLVGSVYFLPALPQIVGDDLFIIGSIIQFIPQILAIWGVCSLNIFTAPYYVKMIMFKKTVIFMNIYAAAGCFCFYVGTFLFMNQNIESKGLYKEAVILFIVGSIFFVIAPLLALKMRKIRILDPLGKYHDQMHSHFLPKIPSHFYIQDSTTKNYDQIVILPITRSIIDDKQQISTN